MTVIIFVGFATFVGILPYMPLIKQIHSFPFIAILNLYYYSINLNECFFSKIKEN